MSIRAFIPLVASLTLSSVLPLSAVIVHPCSSVAIAADTYGTNGSSGSSGRSGADGRDGADRTVEATEQPLELNLSGADGEDGQSGSRGQSGQCRDHHRPSKNVQEQVAAAVEVGAAAVMAAMAAMSRCTTQT